MGTKNTGRLALSAVMTALAVVILLLTAAPIATIGLAALAGICGIPVVVEWGRKAGLIHFAAVAVLALLLVPSLQGKGMYIAFFGWYTVFKAWIESRHLPRMGEWAAKCGVFAAALVVYGAVWVFLLDMPLPDVFRLWMLPVAAVVACAIFAVYDIGFSRLVTAYCGGIGGKIRQIFRFQ